MDVNEFRISSFFNHKKSSDIKIVLKGDTFYAHSNVLLLRCPKLYDEARGTVVGSATILMESYPSRPLKEMLSLIYTGNCSISVDNYEEVIKLIGKFEPPSDDLCKVVDCLFKESKMLILLNYLQVALDNHVNSVVELGIKIVGSQFSKILKSETLQTISKELFVEILSKTDMVCDDFTGEMEVFEAVLKYIEQHCDDKDVKVNLIPLVRYPTLNPTEFAECFEMLPELGDFIKNPELVLGEISSVECKNSGFNQKKRLSEKEVVGEEENDFVFDLHSCEKYTGFISRNVTVMEVSDSISIIGITLYSVVDRDVTASIEIKNRHGTVLTAGTRVLNTNNGKSVGNNIHLSPLIQLNPNKPYFIHIEYDEKFSVNHFRNNSTESTIKKNMENVDLKLENFNRMICQISAFKV